MKLRIIAPLIVASAVMVTGNAQAAIQVVNKTNRLITVWLLSAGETNYSQPFNISARSATSLPVQPGTYYVTARMRGGEFAYLGWQDYSNHKIVYDMHVSICCGQSEEETSPCVKSYAFGAEVFRAVGVYRCRHGRWRTRWKHDWEK